MIIHLITSFFATAAFAILFNAPRRSLIKCGFVGMAGWFVYISLVKYDYDAVIASFIAAFIIAVISQIFAKMYKTPIIIFSISGIIPLVPGGSAYDAMRHFVENDYNTAIQLAAKAFMISGAIAVGLVISEVLNQLILKIGKRNPLPK
ncbi:threonine/serine exporter family protein [Bacillus sp. S/N-304-OC-R1]|uniref:threonine/serine exporter family protein n=1 Tax=Bacillus sp. S/N-304-OC-R1 TaxID=2758034 RepID=UPI001C8DB39D|nr:threonine/serine exporter family protein [Bacillus sp. S/N-304-OC-R1]MBY0121374.1 threonine/serine exporter family protein [Bacillus sp. S/N-304-OC-R1]